MDSGLFRQKSLDKVSSPEQMNDYIRVTGPGVWLVLAAVIALLAGLIIWSVLGRLETTVTAAAVAGPDGELVCYIAEDDLDAVRVGQTVHVDGQDYALSDVAARPVAADESLDSYALHVGGLEAGQWVYPAALDGTLPEGVYAAQVVVDSVSPISFLLN